MWRRISFLIIYIKGISAAIVVYPKYQGIDLLILGLYLQFPKKYVWCIQVYNWVNLIKNLAQQLLFMIFCIEQKLLKMYLFSTFALEILTE